MKITIEATLNEVKELLQAIGSREEQYATKDSSSVADSEITQVKLPILIKKDKIIFREVHI